MRDEHGIMKADFNQRDFHGSARTRELLHRNAAKNAEITKKINESWIIRRRH